MTALVPLMRLALAMAAAVSPTYAADNGLARTPPLGWRSWNAFGIDVNQDIMERTAERMVERVRQVDGVPTSLLDLGYSNCGLDDGWQDGGAGVNGSFHDAHGKPIVNASKFPAMHAMVAYMHIKGLTTGWYHNNCNPKEAASAEPGYAAKHMRGDVEALVKYEFDGVKLDACGPYLNLTWWYQLINATGRRMLIENCHWGGEAPPCLGGDCPYNYWRVSGDITNTWESVFANIQRSRPYLGFPPLSRPGTWAYPDMLEVGRLRTFEEDRSHFGLWVITSSPLILGFDLRNQSTMDRVWPIIANGEAIAINQAWHGHPGWLAKEHLQQLPLRLVQALPCNATEPTQRDWQLRHVTGDLYEIRSRSTGLCVDVTDRKPIDLQPCTGSDAQLFSYDRSSGAIRAPRWKDNEGHLNGCFDIAGKTGPTVQLTKCYSQPNDAFNISQDGVWSAGTGSYPYPRRCLAAQHATRIESQVWAKPQAHGSMAVLAVNNLAPSWVFELNLASDLNMTVKSGRAYIVRDVWAHADLPGHVTGVFSTDAVKPHDSRLYLLRPADGYAFV